MAGHVAAVRLLPTVAWGGVDRKSRAGQLAQWTGLAADAAGCAIHEDRLELAVELLEQGRSVLWSQALQPAHRPDPAVPGIPGPGPAPR